MVGNGDQQALAGKIPPIVITLRPDGKGVNVTGPLADKELCWRMLTDAAVAILNFKAPGQIVVPDMVPPKNPLVMQ